MKRFLNIFIALALALALPHPTFSQDSVAGVPIESRVWEDNFPSTCRTLNVNSVKDAQPKHKEYMENLRNGGFCFTGTRVAVTEEGYVAEYYYFKGPKHLEVNSMIIAVRLGLQQTGSFMGVGDDGPVFYGNLGTSTVGNGTGTGVGNGAGAGSGTTDITGSDVVAGTFFAYDLYMKFLANQQAAREFVERRKEANRYNEQEQQRALESLKGMAVYFTSIEDGARNDVGDFFASQGVQNDIKAAERATSLSPAESETLYITEKDAQDLEKEIKKSIHNKDWTGAVENINKANNPNIRRQDKKPLPKGPYVDSNGILRGDALAPDSTLKNVPPDVLEMLRRAANGIQGASNRANHQGLSKEALNLAMAAKNYFRAAEMLASLGRHAEAKDLFRKAEALTQALLGQSGDDQKFDISKNPDGTVAGLVSSNVNGVTRKFTITPEAAAAEIYNASLIALQKAIRPEGYVPKDLSGVKINVNDPILKQRIFESTRVADTLISALNAKVPFMANLTKVARKTLDWFGTEWREVATEKDLKKIVNRTEILGFALDVALIGSGSILESVYVLAEGRNLQNNGKATPDDYASALVDILTMVPTRSAKPFVSSIQNSNYIPKSNSEVFKMLDRAQWTTKNPGYKPIRKEIVQSGKIKDDFWYIHPDKNKPIYPKLPQDGRFARAMPAKYVDEILKKNKDALLAPKSKEVVFVTAAQDIDKLKNTGQLQPRLAVFKGDKTPVDTSDWAVLEFKLKGDVLNNVSVPKYASTHDELSEYVGFMEIGFTAGGAREYGILNNSNFWDIVDIDSIKKLEIGK